MVHYGGPSVRRGSFICWGPGRGLKIKLLRLAGALRGVAELGARWRHVAGTERTHCMEGAVG